MRVVDWAGLLMPYGDRHGEDAARYPLHAAADEGRMDELAAELRRLGRRGLNAVGTSTTDPSQLSQADTPLIRWRHCSLPRVWCGRRERLAGAGSRGDLHVRACALAAGGW